MKRRTILATALAGATLASAGVTAILSPFEAARADASSSASRPDMQAALDRILSQSEPGAKVTKLPGGGFSVQGTRTPEAVAMYEEMDNVYESGPRMIACSVSSGRATCTPVSGKEAEAAVGRGETLYGRGVHGAITQSMIDRKIAVFGPNELVCEGPVGSAGTLECVAASVEQPELSPGETAIATYVEIEGAMTGSPTVFAPRPTVPFN